MFFLKVNFYKVRQSGISCKKKMVCEDSCQSMIGAINTCTIYGNA